MFTTPDPSLKEGGEFSGSKFFSIIEYLNFIENN